MAPSALPVRSIADEYDLLKVELDSHNLFFDQLVDMIPAKLYVSGNSGKLLFWHYFLWIHLT
jgi:hypothetical protein